MERDEERVFQPERITTTMEGTGQEILAFMLNNSGITETEYKEMTRRQWTTIRDKLNLNDVIQTLKVFGYKLIAIPNANYMLSKVESYQFVLPEDKIRSLDRAKGEVVNFKPITAEELASYGINIERRNKMHAAIFAASLLSDKVDEANLKRPNEFWAYKVDEPKKIEKIKKDYEERMGLLVNEQKQYRREKRRQWYQEHKTTLKEPDAVEVDMDDPVIVAMREKRMAKEAKKKSAKTDK